MGEYCFILSLKHFLEEQIMYDKTKYIQKQENTRREIKKILDEFIPTLVVSPEEIDKYLHGYKGFYNYSLLNQVCATYEFLAMYGKMPDGLYATFKRFKDHERFVKKGQKGVHMIRPQKYEYEVENEETGEIQVKKGITFRPFVVFDISQTRGKPLVDNDKITGTSSMTEAEIDKVIKQHWELIITDYELVHGSTDTKNWIKLSYHENTTVNSRISTRIHEIAHIKLNHLDRNVSRPIAELEAESVAYMVTTLLGLKNKKSRLYIANWNGNDAREAVKERAQLLLKTAEDIVKLLGIE